MVDSVNSNAGSALGIQSLTSTNRLLNKTQNELTTGRSVNSAADDAATFAIAQQLFSSLQGRNAVSDSLDRALSTVDVSLAAGGIVSDLLLDLKEKAVQASDPGLDDDSRRALDTEFQVLKEQITSTLSSAGFNGTNPLVSGGGDITALSNEKGDDVISISEQDLSLGGSNITLSDGKNILSSTSASSAVSDIEDSINNVSQVLSDLGSGFNRLEQAKSFNQISSDAIETGISNLTDANLASTAANLAAQQVKQSLGIQSLSIANNAPKQLLKLFNE
ncbi:flagellin [Temperatibacter marinus]|uniref:Flagellin n=1 Tax=Temperatibacter marinus TaxID=1456591 RepID=A0AA52EDM4_9PROT|nr:flagellin [Temperatibacter marinus]WND01738.1 flagellin [Temperatibacter marinus]